MQARGPLMIEHRLIERMLGVVRTTLPLIEQRKDINPLLVDQVVDFIKMYADRTHHGKEEDILFRRLDAKELSAADRAVMADLIAEHAHGRSTTKALVEATDRYRDGDLAAVAEILVCLRTLVDFYPQHIEKEDKVFFPAARTYLTEEEDQEMLAEFWEFDRKMIHEKYKAVVDGLAGLAPCSCVMGGHDVGKH